MLLILVQLDVFYKLLIRVIEVQFYSLKGFFYLNILYFNIALQAKIVNKELINQLGKIQSKFIFKTILFLATYIFKN